ncbi:MAG: crossover junction endodeoxyribonuclease RuvC [Candidatus Aureabacteria bacterium]|nr:crossover junction endodeoxyribonuclease RuvC [Candidatus Auribacterota bacterium]
MRVMGIDPGTLITGYGIIDFKKNKFNPVCYGAVRNKSSDPISSRYLNIFNKLNKCIAKYSPDVVALEGQFVSKNVVSAFKLGQAKGIAVLCAAKNGIPAYEYQPKDIKQSVSGRGTAGKEQVAVMIRIILGLADVPKPQDASDALATAICHCNNISNRVNIVKRI